MAHLRTAVLMRLADGDRARFEPVVIQHTLKPLVENTFQPLTVGRHAAVVQLNPRRQTAEPKRSTVHEYLKRGKTLAVAHAHVLHR